MRTFAKSTLAAWVFLFGLGNPTGQGQELAPDTVVVRVNGEPILHRQVEREIEALVREGYPPSIEEIFSQLIARELLHQAAANKGFVAEESEIDAAYRSLVERAGSEELLAKELETAGESIPELRKELARKIAIDKAIDQRTAGRAGVSDASAEDYYRKNPGMFEIVRARHVLKRAPEDAPAEERERALQAIQAAASRIAAGEDFGKVARGESEDPGSAPSGGDLGGFHRGEMVPSFEEAAFSLEPGQVSGVVETRFGFHLIRVEEKKALDFEETREDLKRALGQALRDRLTDEWVLELKNDARIEFNPELTGDAVEPDGDR